MASQKSADAALQRLLQEEAERHGVRNPAKPAVWVRRTGSTDSILGDHPFDYLECLNQPGETLFAPRRRRKSLAPNPETQEPPL